MGELSELVRAREGGRVLEMIKQRAIFRALVTSAVEGNTRAKQIAVLGGNAARLLKIERPRRSGVPLA